MTELFYQKEKEDESTPSDRDIVKAVKTGLKLVKQAAKEGAKEGNKRYIHITSIDLHETIPSYRRNTGSTVALRTRRHRLSKGRFVQTPDPVQQVLLVQMGLYQKEVHFKRIQLSRTFDV